ncbi:methyltransferase domain-containing protein [Roseateles sp.]|uniref:methyltransferase domain-containing protein n=1 Tax=Roseateles sp. TaxID=1971397 RepID=UPI0039ED5888
MSELDQIARRYARRADRVEGDRYSLLRPEVWQMWQERQRALLRQLARRPGRPADWRATEVGCGAGGNLLDLLRLGLAPAHLTGIELIPERLAAARAALPEGVHLLAGDASTADVAPASQDLVLQSTVFSSILDDALQQRLAEAMWHWLKPGGAVVWYDFTVDNPRNADVRGVPLARVRELFPGCPPGGFTARRVTLAPPLARALPAAYAVLNLVPWLRTHRLVMIEKPARP